MAKLGVKTVDELVGRTDLLEQRDVPGADVQRMLIFHRFLIIHILRKLQRFITIRKMYMISSLKRQLMRKFS